MDIRNEVYNALADIMFKYLDNVSRDDMEQAIDWFQKHFWEQDEEN